MEPLDRDTLFRKLRGKPENKARCSYPQSSVMRDVEVHSLPLNQQRPRTHGLLLQPWVLAVSRCLERVIFLDNTNTQPWNVSVHPGCQQCVDMHPHPACLTGCTGLLRLPRQEPDVGVRPLWGVHLPCMCRHPPQPGRARVICEVSAGPVAVCPLPAAAHGGLWTVHVRRTMLPLREHACMQN